MNIIKLGSKGEDVKTLQKCLGLTQDGIFGPNTEKIVKEFQAKNKLVADGIVGNSTWNLLLKSSSNGISESDYKKCADKLGVEVATIKAVKTVESNGTGITNGIPKMLFEGHIFWQELKKKGIDPNKYIKGNENILYPTWTKKYYSGNNSKEYERLKKAIKINEDAAYRSASYGLFQIMGNNCKSCGYNTAKDFFKACSESESKQLEAFTNFIISNKLNIYLKNHNWAGFAKRYNGPAYAKNQYDIKLKNAYLKFK